MFFNSFEFFIFLPIVFILYWFLFNRNLTLQNLLILAASYFFYARWSSKFKLKEVGLVNNIRKEIIIVNDCSTDNIEDILLDYISRNKEISITYYKHEYNQGKGAALHTGISKATNITMLNKLKIRWIFQLSGNFRFKNQFYFGSYERERSNAL